MSSERSTSNKFSKLSDDPTFSDPAAEQQQSGRGMMEEEEDHPPFVTTSESSKDNMIPDPKFAREYIAPGATAALFPEGGAHRASTESRQRSTKMQGDPSKSAAPKESK